ncbi:DUF4234 domain-containing protein [Oribacterium sp. P6A1]|uniref:DUF4234 domain-containing protein n=1 Tax=Oribacterium sp. P6A1 TaxID=1410612 RepID=UPI00056122F4|nr:DUF4234 domain-containing protein [Oribacterium sp. P6A1]
MQVNKRDIVISILLSIVTCGIYMLYWHYCIARDVNEVTDHREDTSAGMVLLLSIVTCGIYKFYWLYRTGTKLDETFSKCGRQNQNRGILFLLLSIFGMDLLVFSIVQSEINDLTPYGNIQINI